MTASGLSTKARSANRGWGRVNTGEAQVVALVRDGKEVDSASAGEGVAVIVNQTPFYAESGGQVGDQGLIRTDTGMARVTDTKKSAGVFIHIAEVGAPC